ncbi:MAG: ABC transporter ATP-binding protein [Candidatus Sedimenticola sp. (ex Thyasira tokunagai)]
MSSDDIIISVRDVTKTYRMFGHPGDRIKQAMTFGLRKYHRKFTAVKDVSFDIRKGEIVGLIGTNGSGKSTLLQLVCGILKPTAGSVSVNGRISALLELGAGFNPEFTGRENVYFQGALMGLTQAEIDQRFYDIAAFADIGEFIDQLVRMYSSGMYLRLAFAIAVNLNSEILVVDEALAVGDVGFQSRCFRKISDIRDSGKTILFVSHALEQIVNICDRAILVDKGELLMIGEPKTIVGQFQRLLNVNPSMLRGVREQVRGVRLAAQKSNLGVSEENERTSSTCEAEIEDSIVPETFDSELRSVSTITYESQGATIESLGIMTESGLRVNNLHTGRAYRYVYRVHFQTDARNVRFGMLIKTPSGIELGGAMSAHDFAVGVALIPKGSIIDVKFSFNCRLNAGAYFLNAGVMGDVDGSDIIIHRLLDAEMFRVIERPDNCAAAIVDFECRADISFIRSSAQ